MVGRFRAWIVLFLILTPVISSAWRSSREVERRESREPRDMRRGVHYHSKRHMLAAEPELKKRTTTAKQREMRKKPSGHLTPLEDDDMENDEVVSVAVAPAPIRPKFDKHRKQFPQAKHVETPAPNITAVSLVKDVLTEITKEFLTRDVNENFVFGQYVGNSMKNLTKDLRLNMQHEILDLIVKYQKLNNGETKKEDVRAVEPIKEKKKEKSEKNSTNAENEETWPDFKNLANIVG